MAIDSKPIEIDPNFFLPPNVVDVRYSDINEEDTSLQHDDDGEIVGVDYDTPTVYDEGQDLLPAGSSSLLAPPDNITVVSQQVRVAADGKFVVDLIIEVADEPNIIKYDVSLSKP